MTKRKNIPLSVRKTLLLEQHGKCGICKAQMDATCQLDHKTPLYQGGTHDKTNLWYVCCVCHSQKTMQENRERAGYPQSIDPLTVKHEGTPSGEQPHGDRTVPETTPPLSDVLVTLGQDFVTACGSLFAYVIIASSAVRPVPQDQDWDGSAEFWDRFLPDWQSRRARKSLRDDDGNSSNSADTCARYLVCKAETFLIPPATYLGVRPLDIYRVAMRQFGHDLFCQSVKNAFSTTLWKVLPVIVPAGRLVDAVVPDARAWKIRYGDTTGQCTVVSPEPWLLRQAGGEWRTTYDWFRIADGGAKRWTPASDASLAYDLPAPSPEVRAMVAIRPRRHRYRDAHTCPYCLRSYPTSTGCTTHVAEQTIVCQREHALRLLTAAETEKKELRAQLAALKSM